MYLAHVNYSKISFIICGPNFSKLVQFFKSDRLTLAVYSRSDTSLGVPHLYPPNQPKISKLRHTCSIFYAWLWQSIRDHEHHWVHQSWHSSKLCSELFNNEVILPQNGVCSATRTHTSLIFRTECEYATDYTTGCLFVCLFYTRLWDGSSLLKGWYVIRCSNHDIK